MYSTFSTFGLAGATLLLGLSGGFTISDLRKKSARDASWANGYSRGKSVGYRKAAMELTTPKTTAGE